MLVLTHKEDPDNPVTPGQTNGTADDLFLRRKNDFTNGPIGFGKDPSINGQDTSEQDLARIILGTYTYGTEFPTEHYNRIGDNNIPKGQIYLQYDEDWVEE